MKPWYASRTLWLNAIAGSIAALVANLEVIKDALAPFGPFVYLGFVVALAGANAALRLSTTTPIE